MAEVCDGKDRLASRQSLIGSKNPIRGRMAIHVENRLQPDGEDRALEYGGRGCEIGIGRYEGDGTHTSMARLR